MTRPLRLAHLSDLHLGQTEAHAAAAAGLCLALSRSGVDHVVISGDVTHHGRREEAMLFLTIFAPLIEAHRLTVVPGNHDRLGDDVAGLLLPQGPVTVVRREGLFVVAVDSSSPSNRRAWTAQGVLEDEVIGAIEDSLTVAPPNSLRVLVLHHHPLSLPGDNLLEEIANRLRWPMALELSTGQELLQRIAGRCDLVLHGHRHVPHGLTLGRPGGSLLRVVNGGSSTQMRRARVFHHADGEVVGEPVWLLGGHPALVGAFSTSPDADLAA